MFRKHFLILLLPLLFISCECCYVDEYEREYTGIHYQSDRFFADKLLGTWQCCYPMVVGGIEFKQILFMPGGKADITFSDKGQWYTETYSYSYYGVVIKFARNGNSFSFTIVDYIFPELMVRDSYGKYVWRHTRTYGCS